ncbi:hypothetical protein HRbin36_01587 [bacterium HR36]|nr:hypothetical protein HRbin36_01587 [bacterium HR36]
MQWPGSAPEVPVLWYFSDEQNKLSERMQKYGLRVPVALQHGIDLFKECFRGYRLALPTEKFDLRSAAEAAGFRFRHPKLDGLDVAVGCLRWRDRGGCDEAELRTLLEYGEDDVLALRALAQWQDQLGRRASPRTGVEKLRLGP